MPQNPERPPGDRCVSVVLFLKAENCRGLCDGLESAPFNLLHPFRPPPAPPFQYSVSMISQLTGMLQMPGLPARGRSAHHKSLQLAHPSCCLGTSSLCFSVWQIACPVFAKSRHVTTQPRAGKCTRVL
ncbi:hypothetical protein Cadr_000027830 [Camelus dromedarius]|uniref:Uncharacterized protein n=1 Tax=Camelus dromedarius TaxID=9838 RepID=A0A5N4C9A5_CAMDR|nr:hypothetical protein Cadr_000027830 [Camelus dromedarius]